MSKPSWNPKLGVASELWLGPTTGIRPAPGPVRQDWLTEAATIGFVGIELHPALPDDLRELGPLLADRGLALAAAPFAGGLLELTLDEEKRRLGPALSLLLGTGCRLLAYSDLTRSSRTDEEMALADRFRLRRDDLRRYGEKLTKLADWLAGEGVALAFQPCLGTFVAGEAELGLLLDSSDVTVGFVLDTGPLLLEGDEPIALLGRHAARLRHVRLQAVREPLAERARVERWSFPRLAREGVLAVPGDEEAALDLAALGTALAEVGYGGWIMAAAERSPERRNPCQDGEMALEALRGLAGAGRQP
jgi:inosose dehydratase